MKAVAWHGKRDVRVDSVPDPVPLAPTDAIVRIITTAICGTHRLPLDQASHGYEIFQKKADGATKVLLQP